MQPSPRWDIGTGNATINLEDYAVLRNAVVRVKDVPIFYLPVLYYPIQSDDRATGFLLPSYGSSTFRGQSLSNAFFWAINRSQDLTLMHDWYTNTGQGAGSEYRYVLAPGSEGNLRAYWLNQKASVIEESNTAIPAERSYEVRGTLAQMLPGGFRARGHVDYFSSLVSQQLYNTDIYYASRQQRTFGGSVTGNWGGVTLTGNYLRAELFQQSGTASTINGYAPSDHRQSVEQAPRISAGVRVGRERRRKTPVHRSRRNGGARLQRRPRRSAAERPRRAHELAVSERQRLARLPQHLLHAEPRRPRAQVPVGLTRRYFDMRADVIGPTFSRVFTPNNAFADRLKHVIEPTFSVQRVTNIENQDRFVQIGGSYDFVVGGVTRISYGLNNRLLVRKASKDPAAAASPSAPANCSPSASPRATTPTPVPGGSTAPINRTSWPGPSRVTSRPWR